MSKPAVVWLQSGDAAGSSPLAERIAREYRVVDAVSQELGDFILIATSSGTAAALRLAREAGESCGGLVLLAPALSPLPAPSTAPDVPTLLLFGMDDTHAPPSSAGPLCAALPRAHPVLIYNAGHALERERPEAVSEVVLDFIARRDDFIVRAESDVIYP